MTTSTVALTTDAPPSRFWISKIMAFRLASLVLVFGAWEICGLIPISIAFPTFLETMDALFTMIMDGRMAKAYASTLEPLVIGVGLSATFGVGFGITMGLSRFFEWLGEPIFVVMQAAPVAALIPLITFAYGIGVTAKTVAVIILAAPIIVLNRYFPANLQIHGNRIYIAPPRELHSLRSPPMTRLWRADHVRKAIWQRFPPSRHTSPVFSTLPSISSAYAGTGLRRRSSIKAKIFWNKIFDTATSASWNVT